MLTASGRYARARSIGVAAVIAAAAAGCGLQAPVVAGVPGGAPFSAAPATSARAPSTPIPTLSAPTPTQAPSAPSTPDATPRRAWPSSPPATEPPCAIPHGAPTAVTGADGPTLTLKQVVRAWRRSPSGKSLGVKTGRVAARTSWPGRVLPSSVLDEPGLEWAQLNTMEWVGIRTYVLPSAANAAAKLATVRRMLDHPCSFQPAGEPAVTFSLTVDQPDHLLASGSFGGLPFSELFVRVGTTVTVESGVLGAESVPILVPRIRSALTKA